ncbi:Glutathione peroxidase [Novymonas esmeraldas]|uniref:Glutathione peroxidase n=1 Tax=Novymonas esmeraldas TaxID=1808958 RepID=A0AAW0F819_9TRYP
MSVFDRTFTGESSLPLFAQTLPPSTSFSRSGPQKQAQSVHETLAHTDGAALGGTDAYAAKTIYDFQVLNCFHELYDLHQHEGSVVLLCNVASKCKDYTESGYRTLVRLHRKHHRDGLVVLAFPSNEFGNGEPGNEDEIAENISCMYPSLGEVDFPIMAKVEVNGDRELPLFGFLKARIRGTLGQSAIRWNFTHFLVDRKGAPYARFAPGATMAEIDARVEELLHPPTPQRPLLCATGSSAAAAAVMIDGGFCPSDVDGAMATEKRALGATTPLPLEMTRPGYSAGALAANFIVTDMTRQESPLASEETNPVNRDSFANQASSSTLFNATAATAEGEDFTSPFTPPRDPPIPAEM